MTYLYINKNNVVMEKIGNVIKKNGICYCFVEKRSAKDKVLISENGDEIKWSKFSDFDIMCNDCGEYIHINSKICSYHISNLFFCSKCRFKGERNGMFGRKLTDEQKRKLSEMFKGEKNPSYGKHLTDEQKRKISEKNKGRLVGEKNPMFGRNAWKEYEDKYGKELLEKKREHFREIAIGEKNPFYGKKHTEETKKIISEKLKKSIKFHEMLIDPEHRKRLSEGLKKSEKLKQSRNSEQYKKLKRLQWEKCVKVGTKPKTCFNPKACAVFDYIMERDSVYIQHAKNGGEFLVEGLGYWIDGYDKENNVAYEYDEKYHFIGGKLREKDQKRQKEIEEKLNCKFIRIKDGDYDYIFGNK